MERRLKLVGKRVEIYWDEEDIWLRGTVTKYNRKKKQYEINYDDESDEEDILETYDKNIWRIVEDEEDDDEDDPPEDAGEEYEANEDDEDDDEDDDDMDVDEEDETPKKRSTRASSRGTTTTESPRRSPRKRKPPKRLDDEEEEPPAKKRRTSRRGTGKAVKPKAATTKKKGGKKASPKKASPKKKSPTKKKASAKKTTPAKKKPTRRSARGKKLVKEDSEFVGEEADVSSDVRRSPRKRKPKSLPDAEEDPKETVMSASFDFNTKIPGCKYFKPKASGDFSLEVNEEGDYELFLKVPYEENKDSKWMKGLVAACLEQNDLEELPTFD